MIRRSLTWAIVAVLFSVVFAGSRAQASGRYCYTGGRWSHHYHAGWHRYYGGPAIGVYYAPRPCYVVRSYPAYYRDRYPWDERPAFGLYVSIGGGHRHYAHYRLSHYRHHDYGYRDHVYARYHDRW